jgi:hypothetical protein
MMDSEIKDLYDRMEVLLVKHPKSNVFMLLVDRPELQFLQHFLKQCIIRSLNPGCN